MKLKTILILAAAAFLAATPAIAHEGDSHDQVKASATPEAGQKFTCTMHPEVVQDKPGKCPKCGMKLVPKEDSGKSK